MSRNAGRAVAASCTLVVIVGVGSLVYTAFIGDRVAAQALADVGRFRPGYKLGLERAGFSGRAMVEVFASPGELASLSTCLQSAEVDAVMASYVGTLVDPVAEPEVEQVLRERDKLQVVVRALSGAVLGGLPEGFKCGELVELLRAIRLGGAIEPERSAVYAQLLESPAPIADLTQRGESEQAHKYVEYLREFEGSTAPAVVAAERALAQ